MSQKRSSFFSIIFFSTLTGGILFFLLQKGFFGKFVEKNRSNEKTSSSTNSISASSLSHQPSLEISTKENLNSDLQSEKNKKANREENESIHENSSSYIFEEKGFSLFQKDLEEGETPPNSSHSLEDKISLQLLLDQKKQDYNEARKKAFVEAFLENALEKGYKIKLDENLEIKSIKKIERK